MDELIMHNRVAGFHNFAAPAAFLSTTFHNRSNVLEAMMAASPRRFY